MHPEKNLFHVLPSCFPLFFFLLFVFSACSKKQDPSAEVKKLASVTIRKLQREKLADSLTYPARVRSKVNATLLAEKEALVSKIYVTLGKPVQQQELLLVLRHTDPIYQYAPIQIRSPIAGVVSSIPLTEGTYVATGQKLAAVVNPKVLDLQVEVPAPDLLWVKKGLSGTFHLSDSQSPPFLIQVVGVSPFVDPGTGTASAQLDFSSPSKHSLGLLTSGMQGQATFQVNTRSGFLIPETAVVYPRIGGNSSPAVRILEKAQQVKSISVILGKKQRGQIEILEGLSPEMLLIERSSRSLVDGETVTLENAP